MNIVEKLRLMQTDHIPELGEAIAEIEHLRREAHAWSKACEDATTKLYKLSTHHPRLEVRYWTGEYWEPLYGARFHEVLNALDCRVIPALEMENEMDDPNMHAYGDQYQDDSEVPGAHPPTGHPLNRLAARLGELLDEDHWAECEALVLQAWQHDAKQLAAKQAEVDALMLEYCPSERRTT